MESPPTTRKDLLHGNDDLWDIIMRHVRANRYLRTSLYVSIGMNLWLAAHVLLTKV